jgi:hypothetical protein
MVRGFFSFGSILLAVGVALLVGLQKSGKVDVFAIFVKLPEVDDAFQRGFRSDAMAQINRLRVPASVGEVRGDEPIQAFLGEFVSHREQPAEIELNEVFDSLQTEFPGAQYLAANLITASSREDLMSKLTGWSAVANPDFDSITTTVFRSGRYLGALGVMSRRIPAFSLKAANETGGRFYNKCPHCGEIHALELDRDSRTLILSCPHCDLPFDVLAVGTNDQIRRASDFLEGFQLPGSVGKASKDPEPAIVKLWGQVADQCEYELDQNRSPLTPGGSGDGAREVWKTSHETWIEGNGDCEDTAILLADILISAGFEARVAIGWNGNIGQHAWVVVGVGEKQYILETTLQKTIERSDLVNVVDASAFYQPEQLFDRENIYYTTARPDRFRLDYFSPTLWKSIPHLPAPANNLSQR